MKNFFIRSLIPLVLLLPASVWAQSTGAPIISNRGLVPGQTHDISGIEHISMETGSLFLDIPLASLPAGPGGSGFTLGLTYNSDVFDSGTGGPESSQTGGGWNYSFQYALLVENAAVQGDGTCQGNILVAVFPDGSQHRLTPLNSAFPPTNPPCSTVGPGSYFTADGTSARVDLPTSDGSTFVLYLKNGTRVNGSGYLGSTIDSTGSRTDSITDRNGNTINFAYAQDGQDPTITITDQASLRTPTRAIVLKTVPLSGNLDSNDVITSPGANGTTLTTVVNWSSWTPTISGGPYLIYLNSTVCGQGQSPPPAYCDYSANGYGVTSITLPSVSGDGVPQYFFGYDTQETNPTGWGQLSFLQMPTGPMVNYTYLHQTSDGPLIGSSGKNLSLGFFDAGPTLHNPLTSKTVTYPGPGESPQVWHYSTWDNYNYSIGSWSSKTSATVTDPDGGQRTYTDITQTRTNGDVPVYIRSTIDPNGDVTDKVLRFFRINFSGVPIPSPQIADVTTIAEFHTVQSTAGAQVSSRLYTYDDNGNLLKDSEYGFAQPSAIFTGAVDSFGSPAIPTSMPGGLIRQTTNTWSPNAAAQSSSGSQQANDPNAFWNVLDQSGITKLDSIASTQIVDSSSSVRSWSVFNYDNAVTTGNLTSKLEWDSDLSSLPASLTAGTNAIQTSYTYDAGGNVLTMVNPNDELSGAASIANSYTYCPGGTTVPQQLTRTRRWSDSLFSFGSRSSPFLWVYNWDCASGLLISTTDPSGLATNYSYDSIGRVSSIAETGAIGSIIRTTGASYTVTPTVNGYPAVHPVMITITRSSNQTGDLTLTETQTFDAHGTMATDQKGETYVARFGPTVSGSVTLDAVSNPYFSGETDEVTGWTVTKKDTMGRVIETDHYSGATSPYPWDSNTSPQDSATVDFSGGYITKVTDESGKVRKLTVDGAARMTNVLEDPTSSGLNYSTNYTFDFGDRLTGVSQPGESRSFVYNSLGRLISATNPESGLTKWVYDANGNPLEKADANKIVTTFGYDDLDRLRTKTYSTTSGASNAAIAAAGATPIPVWCYDGDANAGSVTRRAENATGDMIASNWSCTGAPSGEAQMITRQTMTQSLYNGVSMSTVSNSDFWELGEAKASSQQINGGTPYAFGYNWYFALDKPKTETYPSSRTLTWSYDSTARQQQVAGSLNSVQTTYGNVSAFWPSAAPKTTAIGTSLTQTSDYDYRLRPVALAQTGAAAATLAYTWNANGNLATEKITNPAVSSLTQTFAYDNVNRLTSVLEGSGGGGSQTFTYDVSGNRSFATGYNPYPVATPTSFSNSNQVTGWSYDLAGNLLSPAGMVATATATWDAENRIALVYDSSSTAQVQIPVQYYYDADGRRVLKSICSEGTTCAFSAAGAQLTYYTYDAAGELAAEYGPKYAPTTTEYLFTDQLGSTRMMVEAATGTTHCYDTTPFGLELGAGQSGRGSNCYEQLQYPSGVLASVPDKFTGKERDVETGLDYFGARYMSSAQGRFTSPDPLGANVIRILSPQRWNMYSYAINNPLSFTDPTGMDAVAVNFSGMVAGLGHEGVLSIHDDGTATYARFGPATQDFKGGYGLNEPGRVDTVESTNLPTVQFGADHLPTPASYAALKEAVAKAEGVNAKTVRMNYFRTSEAETMALDNWIRQQKATPGRYQLCTRNCGVFTVRGLAAAGAISSQQAGGLSIDPNLLFWQLGNLADQNQPAINKEKVTSKICFTDETCQ